MTSIDATQIQFGEKAQDYVSTKIDGGFIRFALGSVDAPLRATPPVGRIMALGLVGAGPADRMRQPRSHGLDGRCL